MIVTTTSDLKLCPFCGSKPSLKYIKNIYKGVMNISLTNLFYVKCENCGVETERFSSDIYQKQDGTVCIVKNGAVNAIEAWNRRAKD